MKKGFLTRVSLSLNLKTLLLFLVSYYYAFILELPSFSVCEFSSEHFWRELLGIKKIYALATPVILSKMCLLFSFVCFSHVFVNSPPPKKVSITNVLFINGLCVLPPSAASPHLCSIGSCLSSSKMERWGGKRGGGVPFISLGTGTGTWNSWCAPKTNYRGPCPPPGRTGGGGERDC